jgi:hypothetical protein
MCNKTLTLELFVESRSTKTLDNEKMTNTLIIVNNLIEPYILAELLKFVEPLAVNKNCPFHI